MRLAAKLPPEETPGFVGQPWEVSGRREARRQCAQRDFLRRETSPRNQSRAVLSKGSASADDPDVKSLQNEGAGLYGPSRQGARRIRRVSNRPKALRGNRLRRNAIGRTCRPDQQAEGNSPSGRHSSIPVGEPAGWLVPCFFSAVDPHLARYARRPLPVGEEMRTRRPSIFTRPSAISCNAWG